MGGQAEHQWGPPPTTKGQPSWLNEEMDGKVVCRTCGIEKKMGGKYGMFDDINADHAGFGSEGEHLLKGTTEATIFHYVDAKGRVFQTMKELGCPAFILDEMGAIRENRQMVRDVDDRVDYTDDRVDDVVLRLDNLEAENAALKARLNQPIDLTAVVEWLAEMVAVSAAAKMELVTVQIEGRTVAALPPPVADLIIDVGNLRKPELVEAGLVRGSEEPDDE